MEAVNKKGRRLWKTRRFDYQVHSLNVGDFDNDGKNEVLLEETLINGDGNIIKELKMPHRNEGLHRKDNKNTHILFFDNQKVGLFNVGKLIEGSIYSSSQ